MRVKAIPQGPKQCAVCGALKSPNRGVVIHHMDGNHGNDVVENVQWLCHPCHSRHHQTELMRSAERRANLSASAMGRIISQEQRAKTSAALMGRSTGPMPQEIRAQISATLTGRVLSEEHRANIGAASKRRRHSEETRAKMSEAGKRRAASRKDEKGRYARLEEVKA